MTPRRELSATTAIAAAALAVSVVGLAGGQDRVLWALMAPLLVLGILLPLHLAARSRRAEGARRDALLVDSGTQLPNKARLGNDIEDHLRDRDAASPPLTLLIFDLIGFKKYNDSYGFACGDALLRRLAGKLVEAVGADARVYRLRGAQFAIAGTLPHAEMVELRDVAAGALFEIGEGFMIRSAHGWVVVPVDADDVSGALKVADLQVQAERGRLRRQGVDEATVAPTHALSARVARSPYDATELAMAVGRDLALSDPALELLEAATALRDVGMMSLPDAVVHAPGRLTDAEWHFVRLHTLVGERLLRSNFGMDAVALVVRSSHERWDGNGYPDARRGHEIPLASRVVFVCSAFQDMTAPRAHRPALTAAAAMAELERCAGTQFDPEVVAAFVTAFRRSAAERDAADRAAGTH